MGVLWQDFTKTSALASFDGARIYRGDSFLGEELGRYDCDGVYDKFGKMIARFNGNTAYTSYHFSTEALCTYDYNTIYKGGSTWNSTLAVYDGNSHGACAAAILFFNLSSPVESDDCYSLQKINNNHSSSQDNDYSSSKIYNNYSSPENNNVTPRSQQNKIDQFKSVSSIFVIAIIATILFYFTEWGRDMVFNESAGMQVFVMSLLCAVIGFFAFYKSGLEYFVEITAFVAGSYIFVYIGIFVLGIIDCVNQNVLSFWNVLLLLFGSVLGMGVAGPFCLIEIFAVYIAKCLKKGN